MMSFFLYILYVLMACALEGFIRHLPLISVRIDFLWILVLYLSFVLPDLRGGGVAVMFLALTAEAWGAPMHGVLLLPYFLVYLFIRLTRQQLLFEGGLAQVIWIAVLSFGEKAIEIGLLRWRDMEASFDLWRLIPWALLQGSLSLLLFRLFRKFDKASTER